MNSRHASYRSQLIDNPTRLPRRSFLRWGVAAVGAALTPRIRAVEPSDRSPARYPDRNLVALDRRFDKYRISNTVIERLWSGALWAEGCAWNGGGRYVVWSDIPNNRQLRRLDEDGHVSVFRSPSNNSNGNTFDFEGRLLSCEHLNRRVVRYEHNGTVTVLAERWNGKRLNSPNDIVVHPDGGVWFTDPIYGIIGDYEGRKAASELKEAVYRFEPASGKLELVSDEGYEPNGLCFSPDYRQLYIADTGGPAPKGIDVYDVVDGRKLKSRRRFCCEDRAISTRLAARLRESAGKEGVYYIVRFPTRWRL